MMAYQIAYLCARLNLDADRAAMLAALIWGNCHD